MDGKTQLAKEASGSSVQGALFPAVAQKVSFSGTTAKNSTAFTRKIIRLVASENCFIKFGASNVEAANTDHFLPSGVVEYFHAVPHLYVAVIQSTASGTLYISEME
jgi:hypothetical protein